MTRFHWIATFLVIACIFTWTSTLDTRPTAQNPTQATTSQAIPIVTDDGLDPINLIFTGYAPSWWVAANMAGWRDSAYCSGPKTVNGNSYNYTLEHPDPTGIPCGGPRDHVRIWDMGYSPTFGVWSVASTHHEQTVLFPIPHHMIDNWTRPEADARSSFQGGQSTLSVSNYTLPNAGYYQGVFYDGNATIIQLKPSSGHYPVVFSEKGLGNRTSWSVTLNGATVTSVRPDLVFDEPNGTYDFTIGVPTFFSAAPSSGTIVVNGGPAVTNIQFRTLWVTSVASVNAGGRTVSIRFTGNATVATSTVQASTSGKTVISFMATEVGAVGAVNVTIPKSIVPADASARVYIDGVSEDNTEMTSDANNFYQYFLMLYGTHSVQLQFAQPATPYLEYAVGGALTVGILGVVFVAFILKRRRKMRLATIAIVGKDQQVP